MANQVIEIEDDNKLYSFNNIQLSIIGTYEEPWFVGEEICKLLGYSNTKQAIQMHIQENEKITAKVLREKIQESSGLGSYPLQILRKLNWQKVLISEFGLYELIFNSHMPNAREFKDWVKTVLKEIRLKGKYEIQKQLTEFESKLDETKREVVELSHRRFLKKDEIHIKITDRIAFLGLMTREKRDYVYTIRQKRISGRMCPVKHPDLDSIMKVKIFSLSNQLSNAYKKINKKNPDIESKKRNNLYNLEFYETIGDKIIQKFFENEPLDEWGIDWTWDQNNEQAPEFNEPTRE